MKPPEISEAEVANLRKASLNITEYGKEDVDIHSRLNPAELVRHMWFCHGLETRNFPSTGKFVNGVFVCTDKSLLGRW